MSSNLAVALTRMLSGLVLLPLVGCAPPDLSGGPSDTRMGGHASASGIKVVADSKLAAKASELLPRIQQSMALRKASDRPARAPSPAGWPP